MTVYNRTAAKAEQWVEKHGGHAAADARARRRKGADIVFTCVGNDDDLRSIVYGEDGALAGMSKGAILVDHTTASADVARELYGEAKEQGVGFIDAPVSGGQAGAENGTAHGHVRRRAGPFDRAKPVIDSYAQAGHAAGPGRRRAAHQDGQPDLHRRAWCRALPRASPSAKAPASTRSR